MGNHRMQQSLNLLHLPRRKSSISSRILLVNGEVGECGEADEDDDNRNHASPRGLLR